MFLQAGLGEGRTLVPLLHISHGTLPRGTYCFSILNQIRTKIIYKLTEFVQIKVGACVCVYVLVLVSVLSVICWLRFLTFDIEIHCTRYVLHLFFTKAFPLLGLLFNREAIYFFTSLVCQGFEPKLPRRFVGRESIFNLYLTYLTDFKQKSRKVWLIEIINLWHMVFIQGMSCTC